MAIMQSAMRWPLMPVPHVPTACLAIGSPEPKARCHAKQ